MNDDDDAKTDLKPDFKALLPSIPDRTEEEWAAWDAEIAAMRRRVEDGSEQLRLDNLRRHLVEHGCPVKDLERAITGQGLKLTKPLDHVRQAYLDGTVLFVLAGGKGVGKTTAASWWVVQPRPQPAFRVSQSHPRFIDAARLCRWPRFDEGRMRELEKASALVIDDLGSEYDDKPGAFRSLLDGIVNARYAAQLPTLITTNLSGDAFKARYGERIADRIREAGAFFECAGESLRGRKAS